jgi:hypothetical protein
VGTTVNKVDRDFTAKHDSEVIVGLDHELAPNFAVGIAGTWRKGTDWDTRLRIGADCGGAPTLENCRTLGPSDYTANNPSTANGYTSFTMSPNAALVTAGGGGRLRTNRDGYHTIFKGLELTATKRLSNRWMARMAFSYNDWTEHWDDGVVPTAGNLNQGNPGRTETDPLVEGGQVALLSGGSGKASFYSSVKWQMYANAMVQLGWNTDFALSVFGKQGGSYPVSLNLPAGRDGTVRGLATPEVDTLRLDQVWDVDMRLAKTFKISSDAGLTIAAEGFNLFNTGTVLSRSRFANASAFTNVSQGADTANGLGRIEEIIAPRIFRISASFQF